MKEVDKLVPVNHAYRVLSQTEQRWDFQIAWQIQGKSWGMQMLRPYLIGRHLTSWVEHKPLDPLYINTPHQHFNKHRQKV